MQKKILFLGSGASYMLKAIIRNIQNSGYEVIAVGPDEEVIKKHADEADIVVVFLGVMLFNREGILLTLKSCYADKRKPIFIIGNESEIKSCLNIIPNNSVAACLQKPLDMKKLIQKLDEVTEKPGEQKEKHILVVDDDGDFLRLVWGWLSPKYKVAIVNSGMQAIRYLAINKPDLILLDYSMPVTSGPQVLEMIRSEPDLKSIPVFFLTRKGDKESVQQVLDFDPDGYLLKSIGKDALVSRIEEFFEFLESGFNYG